MIQRLRIVGRRYEGRFEAYERTTKGTGTNSEAADSDYECLEYYYEGMGEITDLLTGQTSLRFEFLTCSTSNYRIGLFEHLYSLLPSWPQLNFFDEKDKDRLLGIFYFHLKNGGRNNPKIDFKSINHGELEKLETRIKCGEN